MKKSIFRSLALAGIATFLGVGIAQGEMHLIDPEYDFGLIRELDGIRTGYSRLVNTGTSPVSIRDVRPSCGCTGAEYSVDPIMPGDTTIVSFSYNPVGRPGNFNKSVKVYTDDDQRFLIRLKGRVLGTPQTLSRNYPIECGRLRLSENVLNLNDIKEGHGRHAFIRIVNQSMDTVAPIWVNTDKALSIEVTPKSLAPGEIATLGVYFNSRFEDRTGDLEYVIPVKAEGDSTFVDVRIRSKITPLPSDSINS